MKNKLLITLTVLSSISLYPHGNGGAFVGGSMLGLGTGLAIGNMNRQPSDPYAAQDRARNQRLDRINRQLDKEYKELTALQNQLDEAQEQNNTSKIKRLNNNIKNKKAYIKNLENQANNL